MTNRWRRALAAPSGLFLLAVLAAGLAAPLLPLADPTAIDISSKFLPPSLEHPFGTDLLGRDMLSRMIWGIRTTFVTALLTMIVTAGVGMIAGGAAAAARGRVDALIMRFCDVWMSFPSEVLILALVGMMGPGLENVLIACLLAKWPWYARMMRGLILHLNSAGFVQFARVTGASNMKVLFGHLVPNAAGECFVLGTIDTGSVVQAGSGRTVLSAANTYGGGTAINAGWMQFVSTNSMPASGSVTVNGAGLAVNVGGPGEWSTGTGGAGTLGGLLGGMGGQSGGTVAYIGAVSLGFDTANAAGTQTYSGSITNVGSSLAITKLGTGTLTLSGKSTYRGNTTVNGGTLKITGGIYTNAHSTSPVTVQNGGVLELNTWTYGPNESLGMLTADAGAIVVNNGTIRVNGSTSYGRSVVLNGPAILEAAAGANWTINTTSDNRNWTYNNNSIELAGAGTGTFQKNFSGSGGVTKSGSGTWTLSGTNTYSGATAITAGTLKLAAISSISNSPVINVAGGAVYNVAAVSGYTVQTKQTLGGNGVVTGNVTVAAGGLLAAGGTNATGALSFSTNLTLAESAVIDWNYADATQDVIQVAGALTLPTVATVNVSRVTGSLPDTGVLFTFGSVTPSSPDLTHWVITGASETTRVALRSAPNRVVLATPAGTLIRVL